MSRLDEIRNKCQTAPDTLKILGEYQDEEYLLSVIDEAIEMAVHYSKPCANPGTALAEKFLRNLKDPSQ